jgi:hypothetical protein
MDGPSKCLNCGNYEFYEFDDDYKMFSPRISVGLFSDVKFARYICAKCGFVVQFVTRADLKKIKKLK